MFKKLRLRLTLICTGITGVILCAMAFLALYVAESGLEKQYDDAFSNLFQTVTYQLETETTISYDWLVQTERANRAIIVIEDNGMLLSFRGAYKTGEPRERLIQKARTLFSERNQGDSDLFTFSLGFNNAYSCGVQSIVKPSGLLKVFLIQDRSNLSTQIFQQRVTFILLILSAELLLFLFSWWFVDKTLRPIEIARMKQNDFVSAASHELRSPIAVIKTTLAAIETGTPMERAKFLDIASKEASRMSKLLNDLLLLANFDQQHIQNEQVELDPYSFLLDLFEKYEGVAKMHQQTLRLSLLDEDSPNILCDAHRLGQLFSILMDNALTYTPPEGCITLILRTDGHQLFMDVQDNGKGIKDADKEKIFERFYRVEASHTHKEHSGLGLSIAKEMAHHYHWGLHVTDTPGGGTTFTVSVPIKSTCIQK